MNKAVIILSAILFISLLQFTFAQVQVSNTTSINLQYLPNSTITGFVNLNLSGISANAYIGSNLGQNISLINLLRQQSSSVNYSCSTSDCNFSYTATDFGNPSINFGLNSGQSVVWGFLVSSNYGSINSISQSPPFLINVTSDAQQSSSPQLSIDLLNDGSPEWIAYQPSNTFGQSYGCYSTNDFTGSTIVLSSTPVCEKINVHVSASVNLKALVSGSGGPLTITIQGVNQTPQGTCPSSQTTPVNGQVNCVPTLSSGNVYPIMNNGDFYVCVSGPSSYSINKEHDTNPVNSGQCGFYGSTFPPPAYIADYPIFVQAGVFAPVGSFILNDTETGNSWPHVGNLEIEMSNYLTTKYGNNCLNGCVIPIAFTAFANQNINLSSLQLYANTASGPTLFSNIYNVSLIPATISTKNYQSLILDNAGFLVPSTTGNSTFSLTLYDGSNSYPLLSKTITIAQIPVVSSVNPQIVAAGLPINFTAITNNYGYNMSGIVYQWDFGDGGTLQTTATNMASHIYQKIGTFNLKITILSQGFNSSANFSVSSVAPKDAVNQLLSKDMQSLATIQSQMSSYNSFTQSALNQTLNLNNISIAIQNLQIKNNSASSDSDYVNILNVLLQINLPQSIQSSSSATAAAFLPSSDAISLDAVARIGGGTYDATRKTDYITAILGFEVNNISMTLDYNEFSGIYGSSAVPILDVVKLNFLGSQPMNKVYLFIPTLNNIQFGKNYNPTGGFYGIPLTGNAQSIQFATTDSLSPIALPIFISPSLDQITLPKQITPEEAWRRMMILGLILGGIAVLGIVSYIVIGRWYQKRYESYLFKDRNDLYNIINYIHSSKRKGMANIDIERNLRRSKWTSEQISYVMKRYAGKNVGFLGFKKNPAKK